MRVLLINPPSLNMIPGPLPSFVEDNRGFNPPLGLLSVASYLRAKTGHEVRIIDAPTEGLNYATLQPRVLEFQPQVVGITGMTHQLRDVLLTAHQAKRLIPGVQTVLGGPHGHLFPEETINQADLDYLVLGEGEETFALLVDCLAQGLEPAHIQGLVYRRDGRTILTGPPAQLEDLDSLPLSDRTLLPYEKYSSLLSTGKRVTTIFTSRGCPYQCRFCDRPHLGKRFRARSAQSVLAELEHCISLGIREFLFYDDTFTINRKRVIEVCQGIIERKLDIAWDIRARVDTVDSEMLTWLKRAGCRGVHYGVEAGTEKVLKTLNKGITLDLVRRIFKETRDHGLPTLAYFMIGNPGETREDIEETFRVARELNPGYIHMTVLVPFPGTRIYQDALEQGLFKTDIWREFARNPWAPFRVPHWPGDIPLAELQQLLGRGYRAFYLSPSYIMNSIARLRSREELRKKFKAGLGLVLKGGR